MGGGRKSFCFGFRYWQVAARAPGLGPGQTRTEPPPAPVRGGLCCGEGGMQQRECSRDHVARSGRPMTCSSGGVWRRPCSLPPVLPSLSSLITFGSGSGFGCSLDPDPAQLGAPPGWAGAGAATTAVDYLGARATTEGKQPRISGWGMEGSWLRGSKSPGGWWAGGQAAGWVSGWWGRSKHREQGVGWARGGVSAYLPPERCFLCCSDGDRGNGQF